MKCQHPQVRYGEVLTPDSKCQAPMVPRSCSAILVSFLWGAIGPAEVAAPLGNVTATVGAVLLLVAGARGGGGDPAGFNRIDGVELSAIFG